MLEQNLDVTMRGHETVGPKWDATFSEPFVDLIRCGLEDAGVSDDHLKLAVHSAESGQYSFSYFADQLYGEAARLAFRRDTVFRETCQPQLACQGRWTSAIADDLDFLCLSVNVLQIAVIHSLLAQFGEQMHGQSSVEIA
jgi:hypothetical protein